MKLKDPSTNEEILGCPQPVGEERESPGAKRALTGELLT